MTRNDFLQQVTRAGWCAFDLNPGWVRIQLRESAPARCRDMDPLARIDILLTPEGQINLILPTRFTYLCPGRPGQLRHFRVIANDWADALALIEELWLIRLERILFDV